MDCVICLTALTNPVVTKCGHVFCYNCLHLALRESKKEHNRDPFQLDEYRNLCPHCRQRVHTKKLYHIKGVHMQGEPPLRRPGDGSSPFTSEDEEDDGKFTVIIFISF